MPLTTAFHRRYTVYSRRQRRQPKSDAHAVVHVQRRPTSEAGGESVLPAGEYRYQGGSTIITTNRAVRDRPLAPASLRFFTILNGMPQSRALLVRRIDALGASSYLRDGTLVLRLDPDAFPLAAPLLALGDAEHQNAVLQHRPRQPHVQAAGQLETPAELPEGPLDAQEGGILPARIPHLLPEHLDRPPLHEDRDLVPPHAGKLQPDDQLPGVLVDVRGGQERRVPEQVEERHPPHALPEDDGLPLLPVLSFGRFAHLFLSLARKARRPGPNSGSFRANAMLAIRKPSLFPASYRTPSNSYPSIRSRATSDRSASVSWISPPAPGRVATRAGKMAGERMYRPMIARSDGALAGFGFSTKSSTSYTPSATLFPLMMPYRET